MMEQNTRTPEQALQEREKYVLAFNSTMIDIWKERITLLGVIDTGRLLDSVIALPTKADGKFIEITLQQQFLEYGIWQEYGVGKETPRGNTGHLDYAKVRQKKHWLLRKYFSSVYNLKDFLAESIGKEFIGIVSNAWHDNAFKRNH